MTEIDFIQPKKIVGKLISADVLDKIRAEIERIEISGQIDEHSAFIRSGGNIKTMVLNIIDKYKAENDPQESEDNSNDV